MIDHWHANAEIVGFLYSVLSWSVSLLAVVGFIFVAMNVTTFWLCFFGKASLGIMVIHKFPIVFMQMKCGIPATAWGFIGGFPMMIVVTVVALSLTTVAIWVIQKTFPWLLGERCA